jgi:hypothetical protein
MEEKPTSTALRLTVAQAEVGVSWVTTVSFEANEKIRWERIKKVDIKWDQDENDLKNKIPETYLSKRDTFWNS